MELLKMIESSSLSTWVREDGSLWSYPGILFLHTVGLSIVVGLSVVIDLRLLGFVRRVPVAPLERFFPVIWAGFWLNALSGLLLLAADATAKLASPLFYVKMSLMALALANAAVLRRAVIRRAAPGQPVPPAGKWLALASLLFWFGAAAAGRLLARSG